MGKGPLIDDKNKDKVDRSTPLGRYTIQPNIVQIPMGGGVADKRATGIYKNLGSIRSTRTGYTVLSCVDYKSQATNAVFYLPFPDSIFVPAETSWSENSEEGLSGFFGQATDQGGQSKGNVEAGGAALGQEMAKRIADFAPAKAALRTAGLAYNPNNQMYFNGVNFSGGTFTFKLVPKNAVEAAVMYSSAKCILELSLPGAAAGDVLDVLKEIKGIAESFFTRKGNEDFADDAEARQKKVQEDMAKKQAEILDRFRSLHPGGKYLNRFQPAFFSYPPVWDISFHIPTNDQDKTVFEWCRLALENVRLDVGSGDLKWHADGLPVSMTMTLQVKETVLKYAGNIEDVMPVIII